MGKQIIKLTQFQIKDEEIAKKLDTQVSSGFLIFRLWFEWQLS